MAITSGLVLFAVIWFMTFLVIIPIRIETQGEKGSIEPGTHAGAPENHYLKQKALITKTELLSKEINDHTSKGQENASLLDANKNFDQALELLKKDLLQISAELNKQNERITFASNQCKLAEEHLSQSLSLRNKIPGIIKDKKILFDDSETARVNKESEMKKSSKFSDVLS